MVGAGKKTVDYREIKDRFTSLDLKFDWKRLERLQKMRNSVEHHVLPCQALSERPSTSAQSPFTAVEAALSVLTA